MVKKIFLLVWNNKIHTYNTLEERSKVVAYLREHDQSFATAEYAELKEPVVCAHCGHIHGVLHTGDYCKRKKC